MSTANDDAIRAHLRSAANVVEHALAAARIEDPEGAQYLAAAVRAGAFIQLRVSMTLAGLAQLVVEVIEPNGTTHTVSSCSLQREAVQ